MFDKNFSPMRFGEVLDLGHEMPLLQPRSSLDLIGDVPGLFWA